MTLGFGFLLFSSVSEVTKQSVRGVGVFTIWVVQLNFHCFGRFYEMGFPISAQNRSFG